MSFHWREIEEVLTAAKQCRPTLPTIVGGAIVTADPGMALGHLPIDIGVIGEGELTIRAVAEALATGADLNGVAGLALPDGHGGARRTGVREPIADLDELPSPAYEDLGFATWRTLRMRSHPSLDGLLFDSDEDPGFCEVLTSRSCPFNCTFCYHPLGQKYRQRSLDAVFAELEYLVRVHGVRVVNILDECFSVDRRRLLEFARRIKTLGVRWLAQWRADLADPELFATLRASGLMALGIGMESMSDTVLTSMRKHVTRAQIEKAYATALAAGIRPSGNLIFGDVAETPATVRESMAWRDAHPEHDVNQIMLLAVPDAPLYRNACARGLIPDPVMHTRLRFPPVNVSRLSAAAYRRLCRQVEYAWVMRRGVMVGPLVETQVEGHLPDGRRVFRYVVACPACGRRSTYRHPRHDTAYYGVVLCKHCLKKLRIRCGAAYPGEISPLLDAARQASLVIYKVFIQQSPSLRAPFRALVRGLRRLGLLRS